jgi:hypothetical protein
MSNNQIDSFFRKIDNNPIQKTLVIILAIIDGFVLLFSLTSGFSGLLAAAIICFFVDTLMWQICGFFTRCPFCNERFAMVKESSQYLGDSPATKTVRQKIRNKYGEVIATYDQTVPATRSHYLETYRCLYCKGEKKTNASYKS